MTDTTITLDDATARMARQLADATDQTVETIVREAIAAQAGGHGILPAEPPRRVTAAEVGAAIDEAVAKLKVLPVLDDRSPDEIIGYDEHGLPR